MKAAWKFVALMMALVCLSNCVQAFETDEEPLDAPELDAIVEDEEAFGLAELGIKTGRTLRSRPTATRACGRTLPLCRRRRGRCTSLDVCKKLLGDNARWISHKNYCRTPRGASTRECGCCFKGRTGEVSPSGVLNGVETEVQAVGMALQPSANDPTHATSESTAPPSTRMSFKMNQRQMLNVGLLFMHEQTQWTFTELPGKGIIFRCDGKTCVGEGEGDAHSALVDKLFPPGEAVEKDSSDRSHHHDFESQTVPTKIAIKVEDPNLNSDLKDLQPQGRLRTTGEMAIRVETVPTKEQRERGLEPISLSLDLVYQAEWTLVPIAVTDFVFWPWPFLEQKRSICVQPVRTRHKKCLFQMFGVCWIRSAFWTYSGAGLNFGRPGADLQWGKVDVYFNWQNWITIDDISGKYQELSVSEMSDLRAEVNVDNCIEVFFVPKFSPSDEYGGGACWSGGTSSAKIISSDENAECPGGLPGVDETHLAHELGHAIDLKHPGSNHATRPDGSTGSLMCGSGFQRDNPRVQSKENGDNAGNPLMINYWGLYTIDNWDCLDSADCGPCPNALPTC